MSHQTEFGHDDLPRFKRVWRTLEDIIQLVRNEDIIDFFALRVVRYFGNYCGKWANNAHEEKRSPSLVRSGCIWQVTPRLIASKE